MIYNELQITVQAKGYNLMEIWNQCMSKDAQETS